jgi:voltage-gated potassium channel
LKSPASKSRRTQTGSAGEDSPTTLRRRLMVAGMAMIIVYGGGTLGYYVIGGGNWGLGDCAYMTVISLTTVGYGETLTEFHKVPYARLFTALLLVTGAGIALYFVSVLTTFLVEGEFLQIRRRRKMRKRITNLSDHIIVCGVGGTGRYIVDELVATQWPFVAVDIDAERLARCAESHPKEMLSIEGDATDDDVLREARIEQAHGVVATLPEDRDNLYIVISARELNPRLRIVAKAMDPNAVRKLQVAGADSVVSVNVIGGLRMVSEMIRPSVVTFLDKMMRDKDKKLRFEEVVIPEGSPLVNMPLAESDIRKARNLLIVAARRPDGEYTYSPGPQFQLEAQMTLIVIGETDAVRRLRRSRLFAHSDDG